MNNELMKKAYEDNNGVWPYNGWDNIIVSTESNNVWGAGHYKPFINCELNFLSVMDGSDSWLWVGTKAEFDAYGESLKSDQEINWDEAPEGATAYNKGTTSPWLKKDDKGEVYFYNPSKDGNWRLYSHQLTGLHHHGKAIKKPTEAKPWVPEVGVECEVSWYGDWQQTFIVGKDSDGDIVYETSEFSEGSHFEVADSSTKFRPIKTKLDEKALSQAIFEAARDSGESEVWREILSRVADNLSENHIGWDREKFVEFGALPADWRKK